MSVTITSEKVEALLLPDGKWYAVAEHSFVLSPYEFVSSTNPAGNGAAATPSLAATWKDNMGKRFVCPVSAMLAVRYTN
jgi:hypothetical protein